MSTELKRAAGVSIEVEQELSYTLMEATPFTFDPEIALLMPLCGPASHSLARYLKQYRGRDAVVHTGTSPAMTQVDHGYEFRHSVIRCADTNTVIDPTCLQVLSFTGYHGDYALTHFPFKPNSLAGDVKIMEFADTPAGSRDFADAVTDIVWQVREHALPIRDSLEMLHGQPFLDMQKGEIRDALRDLWDMSHYQAASDSEMDDDFEGFIGDTAAMLAAVSGVRVQ